jgi:hypothetical protein
VQSLDSNFIICRHVGLDFFDVIVSVCKCIVNVGRFERGILLNDLLDAHSLPITAKDDPDAHSRARDDRLPTATGRV